jgi:hypothetical protein
MERYHISDDEVEAVVWYPVRRDTTPSAVEHYGFVDDGRKIKVVTNRAETFVFTITDVKSPEKRPARERASPQRATQTHMKHPIRVTVDPDCALGYIEYREPSEHDGYLDIVREPDGSLGEYGGDNEYDRQAPRVMVWLDDDDEIVAFEIISIDEPELVAVARDYARDNDLAFPGDIRAAAASRDPAA